MEKSGIIKRVEEPTEVSSIVITSKNNSKLRLCINKLIIKLDKNKFNNENERVPTIKMESCEVETDSHRGKHIK